MEKLLKIVYSVFPFLERYHNIRQFIKFCIVGSTNATVDFFLYLIATRFFSIYFVFANIISFSAAVTWSFIWNKRWTFKNKETDRIHKQYGKFFIINTLGVIIQTSLLYFLVEHSKFNDIIVKAGATVVIAIWNFSMSRFWVFRIK